MVIKRRYSHYTSQTKFKLIIQIITKQKTQAQICKEYNISSNLINKWKNEFLKNGYKIFEKDTKSDEKDKKIQQLENIIGKQTVEIALLKKILNQLD